MELALSLAGVVLLAASLWWRTAPAPGRHRWWTTNEVNRRAGLQVFPGIALGLFSAWPLLTYDAALAPLGGEQWKLWFVVPALVGLVLAFWGMLFIPMPRWFLPRWYRERTQARRAAAGGAARRDDGGQADRGDA